MSEPLGDGRKLLDNLLQNTVEEHNQQADGLLGVFQRDFPQTYRLWPEAVSRCLFADKPTT
jgi:hypothetical protein